VAVAVRLLEQTRVIPAALVAVVEVKVDSLVGPELQTKVLLVGQEQAAEVQVVVLVLVVVLVGLAALESVK
jgi:hypothetical protein